MGPNFEAVHQKLVEMMERPGGALEWSNQYYSEFKLDKLQLMDFTRKRTQTDNPPPGKKTALLQRQPIHLGTTTITPKQQARYLGVLFDPQLRFTAHFAQALARGQRSVDGLRRITNTRKGVPAYLARRLYRSVIMPRMLYAVDVVCGPPKANRTGARGMIAKLTRVQRQAACAITGALRTTPTELLNIHANLLPLQNYVDRTCYRAALRLSALTPEHPLQPLARKASSRNVKRHISPLMRLIREYSLDSRKIETHQVLGKDWRWKAPVPVEAILEAKDATKRFMTVVQDQEVVVVCTDGSLIEEGVGAAAVWLEQDQVHLSWKLHLGPAAHHTVFEAELIGLVLAMWMVIQKREERQVYLASDSQAALKALERVQPGPGQQYIDLFHQCHLLHQMCRLCIALLPEVQRTSFW